MTWSEPEDKNGNLKITYIVKVCKSPCKTYLEQNTRTLPIIDLEPSTKYTFFVTVRGDTLDGPTVGPIEFETESKFGMYFINLHIHNHKIVFDLNIKC